MIECNHNCLECPYPDVPEECLTAALTWDEYRELDAIDKDIINPQNGKTKSGRRPAEKHCAGTQSRRYDSERACGYSRSVPGGAIALWETGAVKADWDKLCAVLPELEACRP